MSVSSLFIDKQARFSLTYITWRRVFLSSRKLARTRNGGGISLIFADPKVQVRFHTVKLNFGVGFSLAWSHSTPKGHESCYLSWPLLQGYLRLRSTPFCLPNEKGRKDDFLEVTAERLFY